MRSIGGKISLPLIDLCFFFQLLGRHLLVRELLDRRRRPASSQVQGFQVSGKQLRPLPGRRQRLSGQVPGGEALHFLLQYPLSKLLCYSA